MTLDRRDFLLIGGSLAAAQAACVGSALEGGGQTAIAAPATAAAANNKSSSGALQSWQNIRELFDLDWSYMHMAGLLLASHPRPVRAAIDGFRAALDRNPVLTVEEHWHDYDQAARTAAAAFLGAPKNEVALTDSTTMGLSLLYGGFVFRSGQEILTTEHDHYVTHEALRFRALRDNIPLRKVALFESSARATEAEIVSRLVKAVTPRTRLVAITWVHSSTGMKLPVRAIADALARLNEKRAPQDRALLAVDGVHGFGVEAFKVADLGCDFFVAGCHKWIFGPRGTGLLWGRQSAWHNVQRIMVPFENEAFGPWMNETPETAEELAAAGGPLHTPGGFHTFEHRWALPAAFQLHEQIGRPRIQERVHSLNTQLKEGLAGMKHVTLHTPMTPALSAGLICFEVAGLQPKQVTERLHAKRIIASTTPYRKSYARFTPGLLNTPEEVDTALRAVRELA